MSSSHPFTALFARVLEQTQGEVRAYVAALGVPLAAVDDVAQEVFLAWYRSPHAKPAEVEPVRWLKGIARRMALRHHRQAAREGSKREALAQVLASEVEDLPVKMNARAEAALAKCLEALSERNRRAVRMTYEEGRDSQAVGAALGMGAGAVRVMLFRLRAALRGCVEEKLREEPA